MNETFAEFSPQFLKALPEDELKDLMVSGPFPVVTTCFNCNTSYEHTRGDIRELYMAAGGHPRD